MSESIERQQRVCISVPISEVFDAARFLDAAVSAHLQGKRELAEELIRLADMPVIYQWLKPIWANSKIHVRYPSADPSPVLPKELRSKERMPPGTAWKGQIHQRDGYNCRFCGMPVVRAEVRKRLNVAYPNSARWGAKEADQHAGLQAMWAQYDHLVPHAKGGRSDLENMVLTCAACNFGRAEYLIEEVGVEDPRSRAPRPSTWDGLERFS